MENNTFRALKQGTVPSNNILELCIGKDSEIREFQHALNRVYKGDSIVKFICSEYGGGKSHFLKVIEKLALENNFIVSYVKILPNFHTNLNNLYRSISNSLHGNNANSLEDIISNWIEKCNDCYLDSIDETENIILFNEFLHEKLFNVKNYSPSFASAIEQYSMFKFSCDFEKASSIISWLSMDIQVPFSPNNFNYDINVFEFLSALSCFIKLSGYSGLVILFDDMDAILSFKYDKLMDMCDYIKYLIDYSNGEYFKSLFSVFSVTPELLMNQNKGFGTHTSLDDMVRCLITDELDDVRNPILNIKEFNEKDLKEIANKLVILHEKTYKWDAFNMINPILDDVIMVYIEDARLTGGKVNPRIFIRSFIRVLDTVQQNQSFFKNPSDILEMFWEHEDSEDVFDFDEIDEFDDDW